MTMLGSSALRHRVTRVTGDVIINVVANLVAGGVIYLFGEATGIFKHNAGFKHAAIVAVILGGALATLLMVAANKQERVTYLIIAGTLPGPAAIAVAALFDFPVSLRFALAGAGLLLTVGGWALLRHG